MRLPFRATYWQRGLGGITRQDNKAINEKPESTIFDYERNDRLLCAEGPFSGRKDELHGRLFHASGHICQKCTVSSDKLNVLTE